jgi:ADP-glucose pyrophosphorylase
MPKPNVLALVMAGGEGSRLELLTERRAGVTVVTSEVPSAEASRQAVVEVDGDGPALVAEEARVPGGARVAPGGRFGADHPGEAA